MTTAPATAIRKTADGPIGKPRLRRSMGLWMATALVVGRTVDATVRPCAVASAAIGALPCTVRDRGDARRPSDGLAPVWFTTTTGCEVESALSVGAKSRPESTGMPIALKYPPLTIW